MEVEVKSRAGRRGIVLPDQLYALLMDHRAAQDLERERAADLWTDEGWMFAQPTGRPVDPRRDMAEWKALLADAGCGTRGCTMPGTRRQPCSCSWRSQSAR